ncbi:MAG: 4Fe-4S double cluster binding domain-containing protein [Rectinemataceae bacterium]|nr:hypothetical protein [Spirochaetaceae bacterium]
MDLKEWRTPTLDREAGALVARRLFFHVEKAGFYAWALLERATWEPLLNQLGAAPPEAENANQYPSGASFRLWDRYSLDACGPMLVVALRYASETLLPAADAERRSLLARAEACGDGPITLVAKFARGNWYRECIDRLQAVVKRVIEDALEEGIALPPPRRWHRFSNSRLPEKALAIAAGIGAIGRNSLVIARTTSSAPGLPLSSSAVVLGVLTLPFSFEIPPEFRHRQVMPSFSLCGTCQACISACPSGALLGKPRKNMFPSLSGELEERMPAVSGSAGFRRRLCIQHYTATAGELPSAIVQAWSNQLYGCDICLECCPHFNPDTHPVAVPGALGNGKFAAHVLATVDDEGVRALFKGTTLDQRWIEPEALRRNAALTLRKSGT